MTWPRWLRQAVRNRHRHAIEEVSRRWRGGRRGDQNERVVNLISTQVDESNGFFDYGRDNNVFTGTKCEDDDCGVTFELDPIAEAGHKLCTESGFGKSECRAQSCCRWTAGKTCVWIDYEWSECRTGTRLDVTAADARGAGAFSTLLLVGSLLVIAAFIVARKATRSAEAQPLLATTA